MDDVKDHFADRRADLSYMIAPEQSIELGQWRQALGEIIHSYAAAHGVPVAGLEEEPMDD
jgi:aminoglycoside phosphotransferase (APT) family kinase protein